MKLIHKIGPLAFLLLASFSASGQLPPERAEILAKEAAVAKPEYRTINGVTNQIWKAANWAWFYGKVTHSAGQHLLADGDLFVDGDRYGKYGITVQLRNYPVQVVDEDKIGNMYKPIRVKLLTETHTYSTVFGSQRVVRIVDYGTPCGAPLPPAPIIRMVQPRKQAPGTKE